MTDQNSRIRSDRIHDDGVNCWRLTAVAPPPCLCGLIDGYTGYTERTGSFKTRRELPHAQAVLAVNLAAPISIVGGDGSEITLKTGEAFIAGSHLRPAFSSSTGAQAGVHIHLSLASLRRLTGVPMDQMIDQVLPLNRLLGKEAIRFCNALVNAGTMDARIALLDAGLTACFDSTAALPSTQLHALKLLRERPAMDISDVARAVGWSRKHLANRVHDVVGVGPRSWRRLLRFEALIARLSTNATPDWIQIAQSAGYCDQSHMIREFREFAGMTPQQYFKRVQPDGGGLPEQ